MRRANLSMPRWTHAERTTLRMRAAEGVSDAAIAAELGRSWHAVYCQRQRLGIRTRLRQPWTGAELRLVRELVQQGSIDAEIAAIVSEQFGTFRSTVAVRHARREHGIRASNAGRPPSLIRQARIMGYLADGCTLGQIAKLMRTPWRALRVTVEGLIRDGLVRRTGGHTTTVRFKPTRKWGRAS